MIRLLFLFLLFGSTMIQAQSLRPQLALQIGHMARANALAASPDGTLLASGGADKSAKIWDARTGQLRWSLPHGAPVLAVAFQSNATLCTADATGTVRRFDVVSGALRDQREGASLAMSAAAFSADATRVAFALPGGAIEISEVSGGKAEVTLDGHPTPVLSLSFSPDGSTLASSSDAFQEKPASEEFARRAGDVRLWDTQSGELIRTLRGHALAVRGLAWSRDGSKLASVGESGTVVLWNARTFAKIEEFNVSQGQGRALCVAFSGDGARLVAGWRGGTQVFELKNSAKALWSQKDGAGTSAAVILGDGRVLTGNNEGRLQFLAAQNGAARPAKGRIAPLSDVRASPDGNFIACAATDGTICLWDAKTGALLRAWHGHDGAVRGLAFSPDGAVLGSVGDDKSLRLWEIPAGRLSRTVGDFSGAVTAIAFSSDGKTLAAGADSSDAQTTATQPTVTLWNVASGAKIGTLDEPRGPVYSLSFAPDGTLSAACGHWETGGEVLLWNPAHQLRARGVLRGARCVSMSPDGRKLAAAGAFLDEKQDNASAGDVAQIWGVRAGEMTREQTALAPDARALGIAFSGDAKTWATASRDGRIRLWNAASTVPLQTLVGHDGPVNALFFAGKSALVSAGSDGTVRLWNAATGRALATLLTVLDPETAGNQPIGAPISPDWLALTPEGYFDGSPGADRFVRWRLGPDVFPVEAFERAFRRSDAVGAALRGENLERWTMATQFATGQAIPPQVSIVSPGAGNSASEPLRVQIAASDDKNLKSIQLFLNGRPTASQAVKSDAKPLEIGAKPLEIGAKPLEIGAKPLEIGAKPLEIGAKPLEIGAKPIPSSHDLSWNLALSAPLPPFDGGAGITLKALVTDGDGLQGSDEIRLTRNSATQGGKNGGFGTLRVLCVGVSRYQNPAYNLKYAAADASAFAALWNGQSGGLFERVMVSSLTDAGATSGAVKNAIRDLTSAAKPDDVVAIFLSGHGIKLADDEFFFATHDVNLEKIPATTLPWNALQEALGGSKARRVVLFLDACHSGVALGAQKAGNEAMAGQLVKGAGAMVFSSSLGSQVSLELDALQHGAFTQALLDGIGKGEADLEAGSGRDGVVNVEELLTFLRARVPQLTQGAQIPACPLLRDFGEPFPLAKVR